MPTSQSHAVTIAGGGLGGLTAALSLRHKGIRVTVLEQAQRLGEVGAGIQTAPNASRVLLRLGLRHQLEAIRTEPTDQVRRRWRDGSIIASTPLGDQVKREYGAPYWHYHRADLHRVLLEACLDPDGPGPVVQVHTGTEVTGVDRSEPTRPVAVAADSRQFPGDVVIGADGIRSRVKKALGLPDGLVFAGEMAYRALIPGDKIAADPATRFLLDRFHSTIWYGPDRHLAHYLSLDLCEQLLRDEGWYAVRAEPGRRIGIGYACFSERTGYGSEAFAQRKMTVVPGFDISEVRMDTSGALVVSTGTLSHGQSHETTMAQIVADRLGVDIGKVKIVQGDTDRVTYGWGSFASRSIAVGGSAIAAASRKLADQLREIAAHLLESDVDNTELDGEGGVRLRDDPARRLSYPELADVAYLRSHLLPKGVEPGLSATASFDVPGDGTFSNATHGVVIELDAGTGGVRILRYMCVEDCGVAINPQVVEGQARGGIAQGIAGALFEQVVYDDTGQPLAPSFMEYKVPTAAEIPEVEIHHLETPCAFTESGAKGVGEGGTIGAPAAVLNAVNDALRDTGVELNDTPIARQAIFRALEDTPCPNCN